MGSSNEGLIESYSAFDEAVQYALDHAEQRLDVLDFELTAVELERSERIQALAAKLSSPTFTARILLHRPEHVTAHCPRLLALVQRFAPRCQIRVLAPEHQSNENALAVGDACHLAVRFNHLHSRGKYA